jgi:membrane protein YqaA with SNARE-associated domain
MASKLENNIKKIHKKTGKTVKDIHKKTTKTVKQIGKTTTGTVKKIGKATTKRVKQTLKKHPQITAATKRLIKLTGFAIILSSIIILIYILFNLETVQQQAKNVVGGYGYIGMFVVAFLVDMLFQPLGPELPLTTGLLSGLNTFNVILAVATGSALASYVGYFLGNRYGELGIKKLYGDKMYNKWSTYYNKYGKIAVSFAALTPLPYVPFCWFSGILNMKQRNFLLYAILPRVIRICAVAFFILVIKG